MKIKGEEHYKQIDNIAEDYELIYKFPLHYTLNMGKLCAGGTVTALSAVFAYQYLSDYRNVADMEFLGEVAHNESDVIWMVAGLITTSAFLYRFCHILALRVYRKDTK